MGFFEGLEQYIGPFGVVIVTVLVIIAGVLALFAPFFIYGTNMRTRETARELKTTNKLLGQMLDELKKMPKGDPIEMAIEEELRNGPIEAEALEAEQRATAKQQERGLISRAILGPVQPEPNTRN